MNLKVGKSNGRTYLSIAHGYRDENGKVRTKTVKSLGYLEDLAKDYPDPIAHFKNVVAEMNKKEADENPPAIINLDKNKLVEPGNDYRRNLGYSALSKIYHELGLGYYGRKNNAKLALTQYVIIGASLALFYLTLLAASEHMGFTAAYVAAAAVNAAMTGGYVAAAMRDRRPAIFMIYDVFQRQSAVFDVLTP
ncbi:MAG: inner membrane CreD family protein [Synergistaceae bacterium]|jgi:inner membrane protein involved in colicin E2 resistance|nr:inner membrane CreD family protein [Synergistaceae bacterium]